jgi:photosynthetic reaction center cytochrome c subunit
MRFLVTMLLVLLPISAQQAYKNLKVLTPAEVQGGVMRQYVTALGVGQSGGCNFCHAQAGRDSDENPKKDIARKMITMVKEINSRFPPEGSKVFVTCYTCHRGKTEPDIAPAAGQPQP